MRRLIVAAVAAVQVGCAVKVVRDDAKVAGESKVYQLNSYLWAFVPGTKLPPAAEMCAGRQVHQLDLGMETSDVLLTVVTLGIYVPHRVQVICSQN